MEEISLFIQSISVSSISWQEDPMRHNLMSLTDDTGSFER